MFLYQEGLIQTRNSYKFVIFISYLHQRILLLGLINDSVKLFNKTLQRRDLIQKDTHSKEIDSLSKHLRPIVFK